MNIQEMLINLSDTMTDAEIGAQIGVAQSTVTRLRNGKHKQTSYEKGKAIMDLAIARGVLPKQQATA